MISTERPEPVKPPQTRDGKGISAVYLESAGNWDAGDGRVYVKRQDAYYCRPVWRGFRRTPTLRRELRGLRACEALGIRVPSVIDYREDGSRAELVLAEVRDAMPLDRALSEPGADRTAILGNVAVALGRLHGAGWTHGALYPDHILVGTPPNYPVTLIDLEKARRSRRRRRSDLDRFWRHTDGISASERSAFEARYRSARRGA